MWLLRVEVALQIKFGHLEGRLFVFIIEQLGDGLALLEDLFTLEGHGVTSFMNGWVTDLNYCFMLIGRGLFSNY